MAHKIDFASHIPYYFQLLEIIKSQISGEVWKAGERLPSEPELCQQYGVSRTVVRQALQELEYNQLITRLKGRGTFVAEAKIEESLVQQLTGFHQDMTERGYAVQTQVLRHEVLPAPDKVASLLRLQSSSPVFCIERLRFVDGEPIVLVTTYLPQALCAGLEQYDLEQRSLYDVLENEFGLEISHGRRTIEAVGALRREAQLLQVPEKSPLILLDSVTCLGDGTPVEYYHALHRGDRSRFEVELQRGHRI